MSELFSPAPVAVSELNAMAKNLLENHLRGLWVSGEVSNLTRAASGHYYFSLKDSKAQIRCAMFKSYVSRLATPLKEGDQVELTGKISIYEARGEYQISVTECRLAGLGRLFEAYERLKTQLQMEGLFAPERKQAIPSHPKAIGIVTSLAAAALRDVVSTLKRRMSNIPVIVYPTPVQGAGSEQQIASAIHKANQRQEVSVLLVCRGGGSIEDLWAFNEEVVARAIAASTLPIVSGVGHETDFTIADFVADLRAPTPTGAAELVSPNKADLLHKVGVAQQQLYRSLQQRYFDASQKLDWLSSHLPHPRQTLQQQRERLQQHQLNLTQALRHNHFWHSQKIERLALQLRHQQPNTEQAKRQLSQQQTNLSQAWQQLLQHKQQQLQRSMGLLEAISPNNVLARGFSIVTDSKGKVITRANQLKLGQSLNLRFAEGEAKVRVQGDGGQGELF